jgi:hypothetical protein
VTQAVSEAHEPSAEASYLLDRRAFSQDQLLDLCAGAYDAVCEFVLSIEIMVNHLEMLIEWTGLRSEVNWMTTGSR